MGMLKLTSTLEGVSGQVHAVAALPTGQKFLSPISGKEQENLTPVGTEISVKHLVSRYRTVTLFKTLSLS
jgi:hypothetical protein